MVPEASAAVQVDMSCCTDTGLHKRTYAADVHNEICDAPKTHLERRVASRAVADHARDLHGIEASTTLLQLSPLLPALQLPQRSVSPCVDALHMLLLLPVLLVLVILNVVLVLGCGDQQPHGHWLAAVPLGRWQGLGAMQQGFGKGKPLARLWPASGLMMPVHTQIASCRVCEGWQGLGADSRGSGRVSPW